MENSRFEQFTNHKTYISIHKLNSDQNSCSIHDIRPWSPYVSTCALLQKRYPIVARCMHIGTSRTLPGEDVSSRLDEAVLLKCRISLPLTESNSILSCFACCVCFAPLPGSTPFMSSKISHCEPVARPTTPIRRSAGCGTATFPAKAKDGLLGTRRLGLRVEANEGRQDRQPQHRGAGNAPRSERSAPNRKGRMGTVQTAEMPSTKRT